MYLSIYLQGLSIKYSAGQNCVSLQFKLAGNINKYTYQEGRCVVVGGGVC